MRIVVLICVLVSFASAQTHPPTKSPTRPANADQLGMTCSEILQMSSTDWIAKFNAAKGSDAPATIRAINAYGKCYDARTDQLAASLAKSGKGPLMGARGNFQSIEKALKTFTSRALADSQPPADVVKSAYAALYEKEFRYEFYEEYLPKPAPAVGGANSASTPSATSPPAPAATAPSTTATSSSTAAVDPTVAADARKQAEKASNADPVTQAKNHFGELLGDLPDQRMHDLHSSFGEILGPNSASPQFQLLIYRYAIFLLEPPGGQPFSPPPF
jgi:hypothetical protein